MNELITDLKSIDGKSLKQLVAKKKITKEKLDEIIDRTRKGGGEINRLLEKGSAFYAPAASGIEMAESYIKDLKKILPCAAYLNGEYGVKNLYVGVPIKIGKNGVEKVIEIDLSVEEKKQFDYSIQAVQRLIDAAKKIAVEIIEVLHEMSKHFFLTSNTGLLKILKILWW